MKDPLKLENQLCFPLYAAAKETVRLYRPLLDPFGLTYTQYIAMMALWEHKMMTVKELGEMLYLDSGTLTPMLKKMEQNGWVTRKRSKKDERNVVVSLAPEGKRLRENMLDIPSQMQNCVVLTAEETLQLYRLLYKLLGAECRY